MPRRQISIATFSALALAACAQTPPQADPVAERVVEVRQATAAWRRNTASLYDLEVALDTGAPAVGIHGVEARIEGQAGGIPLAPRGAGVYGAAIPMPRCAETASLRLLVSTEVREGRRRIIEETDAPAEGPIEIALSGQPPIDCAGFERSFLRHFTVDDTRDAVDAAPGDGRCATEAAVCSLRAAVMEANALPGPDLILLRRGAYQLTLEDAEQPEAAGEARAEVGDLDVTDALTILGIGDPRNGIVKVPSVEAGQRFRVFEVHADAEDGGGLGPRVEFRSFRIARGLASNAPGGAILNRGALRLDLMRLSENQVVFARAGEAAQPGAGGAVANFGRLVMTRSIVQRNLVAAASATAEGTATGRAGGLYNAEGAYLEVAESLIGGNTAPVGGGLYNAAGAQLRLTSSTVGENESLVAGGGLVNEGEAVFNSATIAFNTSLAAAGGIAAKGRVEITNSIVAENRSDDGPDCQGEIASSGGGNAFGQGNDCKIVSSFGKDLLVGPLWDRGRPAAQRRPRAQLCAEGDRRQRPGVPDRPGRRRGRLRRQGPARRRPAERRGRRRRKPLRPGRRRVREVLDQTPFNWNQLNGDNLIYLVVCEESLLIGFQGV